MADPRDNFQTTNFRLDPLNSLGIEARKQREKLKILARTKPSLYDEFHTTLSERVIEAMIENIYNKVYFLLSEGYDERGVQIQYVAPRPNGMGTQLVDFKPKLNYEICNQKAAQAAEAVYNILNESLEMILPEELSQIAFQTDTKRSRAREGLS